MRPNVKGRMAKVRIRGGRRVVYGRVARRKDYMVEVSTGWSSKGVGSGGLQQTCGYPIVAR